MARKKSEPPQFSEALVEVSKYAVMDCASELWRTANVLETVEFRGAFHPDECRAAIEIIRQVSERLGALK